MIDPMDDEDQPAWFQFQGQALADVVSAQAADLEETDLFWAMFDFYNHLMMAAKAGERVDALAQARTLIPLFHALDEPRYEALFLEAEVRLTLGLSSLRDSLTALERFANCAVEDQYEEVAELAQEVWDYFQGDYHLELSGLALAALSRIYRKLGQPQNEIQVQLEAAALYAHNGARASADAALSQARQRAQEVGSDELLARVLTEAVAVSWDRRDAAGAVTTADEALRVFERAGLSPPPKLLANRATSLAQLERLDEAAEVFEALVPSAEPFERAMFLMNLASVRRRQGRLDEAKTLILEARQGRQDQSEGLSEQDIELELITASIALDAGDPAPAVRALAAACNVLGVALGNIFRLHHRRGLRERYVSRLEGLAADLPSQGDAADILPVLVSAHGGLIADWMAFRQWLGELEAGAGEGLRLRAASIRQALAIVQANGAPYLSRAFEGSDNAWQPALEGTAWDDLGIAVDAALASGAPPVFAAVALDRVQAQLEDRLSQGWIVLAPTFHPGGVEIWVLTQGAYRRVQLDLRQVFTFVRARNSYSSQGMSPGDYKRALSTYLQALVAALGPELGQAASSCPGILLLQDFLDSLPIMGLALEIPALRTRMAAGALEVRTVPALFAGGEARVGPDPAIVALVDSAADLQMAAGEGQVVAQAFTAPSLTTLEADDEAGALAALTDAEMLVVSTHGLSIAHAADPAFGSLAGPAKVHTVSVGTIQRHFLDLPYRLVMLNACHAGSAAPPPVERGLRTHDAASYPALLLMNGQSVVGAPGWQVSDTVAVLYAGLVGQALADKLTVSMALCRSAAILRDLDRSQIVQRLEALPQTAALADTVSRFKAVSQEEGLFAHPYVCGGFGVYTLL